MPLLNHTPKSDEFRCEFCGKLFTRKHLNVYHKKGYRSYCNDACIQSERDAKAAIRNEEAERRDEMRPVRAERAARRAEARAAEEERAHVAALVKEELAADRARTRAAGKLSPVVLEPEPRVYVSPYIGVARPRSPDLLVPPMVRQRPI